MIVKGGIEKVEEVKKQRNLSEPVLFAFGFGKDGVLGLARQDSAEHFSATKSLRCTAVAWMLIVAQCFAVP